MTLVACSSDDNEEGFSTNANANSTKQCAEYGGLEFPRLNSDTKNNVVLVHKSNGILNYCVEWDMQKKSQRWSCYKMYKSIMASNVDRFDVYIITLTKTNIHTNILWILFWVKNIHGL